MQQRVSSTISSIVYRLLFYAGMAVVVGVSGNVFIHFTFKIDVGDVPRFAWENLIAYSVAVRDMFYDTSRLQVSVSAVLLYASIMAFPMHWLTHQVIQPCFLLAGIDNPDLSWRRLWIRFPYRFWYWLMSTLHRVVAAWLVYITYLAHDPKQPVSWLKYKQNVKSPLKILSDPDNLFGFVVFVLACSMLASVFSLMVRRPHREFGYRGRALQPKP